MEKNYIYTANKKTENSEKIILAKNIATLYIEKKASKREHKSLEKEVIALLSDPCWKVRYALAEVLSGDISVPFPLVDALALDNMKIASLVFRNFQKFSDAELIERIHSDHRPIAQFVAARSRVSSRLASSIINTQEREACLILLKNPGAEISHNDFRILADFFSNDFEMREILIQDKRLPCDSRYILLLKTAEIFKKSTFLSLILGEKRVHHLIKEQCMHMSLSLVNEKFDEELMKAFVEQVRLNGQLTSRLILRAAAYGKIEFLVVVFSILSGISIAKVRGFVRSNLDYVFIALFRKAGIAQRIHSPLIQALKLGNKQKAHGNIAHPESISYKMLRCVEDKNSDLIFLLQSIHSEIMRSNFSAIKKAA